MLWVKIFTSTNVWQLWMVLNAVLHSVNSCSSSKLKTQTWCMWMECECVFVCDVSVHVENLKCVFFLTVQEEHVALIFDLWHCRSCCVVCSMFTCTPQSCGCEWSHVACLIKGFIVQSAVISHNNKDLHGSKVLVRGWGTSFSWCPFNFYNKGHTKLLNKDIALTSLMP